MADNKVCQQRRNKVKKFIRESNVRIEAARASNDPITIVNAYMDVRDAFFEADDGSDEMNFYYMDVIQQFGE